MSLSLHEKKVALVDKPSVCGYERSVFTYNKEHNLFSIVLVSSSIL